MFCFGLLGSLLLSWVMWEEMDISFVVFSECFINFNNVCLKCNFKVFVILFKNESLLY